MHPAPSDGVSLLAFFVEESLNNEHCMLRKARITQFARCIVVVELPSPACTWYCADLGLMFAQRHSSFTGNCGLCNKYFVYSILRELVTITAWFKNTRESKLLVGQKKTLLKQRPLLIIHLISDEEL